jgi:hypothetical protein
VLFVTTVTFVTSLIRAQYFCVLFWITWGTKTILKKITTSCLVYYSIYTFLILHIDSIFFLAAYWSLSEFIYIFPVGKANIDVSHKFSVQVVFAFNAIYTHNSYGALPILFEYKVFTAVNLRARRWNSRTQFPKNTATESCWLYRNNVWPFHSGSVIWYTDVQMKFSLFLLMEHLMARISRSRATSGHAAVLRTSGRVLISPAARSMGASVGRRSGERILRVSIGASFRIALLRCVP